MCYIKNEIGEGVKNVTCNKSSEDRLWLKLDADFFGLDEDLFCAWHMSHQSRHATLLQGIIYGTCWRRR